MKDAKGLLFYYFNLVYEKVMGRPLSWDHQAEISAIVDDIQNYIDRKIEKEVKKILINIERR